MSVKPLLLKATRQCYDIAGRVKVDRLTNSSGNEMVRAGGGRHNYIPFVRFDVGTKAVRFSLKK